MFLKTVIYIEKSFNGPEKIILKSACLDIFIFSRGYAKRRNDY